MTQKLKEIGISYTKENRGLTRDDLKTETRRIAKPKYHCPGTYIEHCPGDKYPWYCRDGYGMMDSFRSADELADKCSHYGGKGKPSAMNPPPFPPGLTAPVQCATCVAWVNGHCCITKAPTASTDACDRWEPWVAKMQLKA